MKFSLEEQPVIKPLTVEERMEVVASPEDISAQLESSQERYEGAILNLRNGNKDYLEYLREMQSNLISWKNAFDIRFGTLNEENAFIHNDVLVRLADVSQALEDIEK